MKAFLAMRRCKVWCGVTLATLTVLVYVLPVVMYLVDRSGCKLVDSIAAIGFEIEIGNQWFPLFSSATAMGRFIIPSTSQNMVVFCRVDWIAPWSCEQAWVYRDAVSIDAIKSRELFSSIEQYPWGRVGIVRDEVTQTPGRKLALILEHGVAISAVNLNVLRDIKAIHAGVNKPL